MIKSKFKVKRQRAVKVHKCCKCYGEILPGRVYNIQKYYKYGRFGINKWHDDCKDMNQAIDNLKSSICRFFRKIKKIVFNK